MCILSTNDIKGETNNLPLMQKESILKERASGYFQGHVKRLYFVEKDWS